jgi:hypothetical protein
MTYTIKSYNLKEKANDKYTNPLGILLNIPT